MSFYNHKEIEPKWQGYWQNIIHLRQEQMHQNLSFMLSICSLIRLELVCTQDTQKVIQQPISSAVTNVRKATMSFTQWVGMLLVCLQSNTLWIQEMTQRNSQQKTLPTSNAKSMRLASLTTGTVKSILQIRTTTSGRNGSSLSFTKKVWLMKLKCQ